MTLDEVKRILKDHAAPSFDRWTVEALVKKIEELERELDSLHYDISQGRFS